MNSFPVEQSNSLVSEQLVNLEPREFLDTLLSCDLEGQLYQDLLKNWPMLVGDDFPNSQIMLNPNAFKQVYEIYILPYLNTRPKSEHLAIMTDLIEAIGVQVVIEYLEVESFEVFMRDYAWTFSVLIDNESLLAYKDYDLLLANFSMLLLYKAPNCQKLLDLVLKTWHTLEDKAVLPDNIPITKFSKQILSDSLSDQEIMRLASMAVLL